MSGFAGIFWGGWIACIVLSTFIAIERGRNVVAWFLLGVLLGPLALIGVLTRPNKRGKVENPPAGPSIVQEQQPPFTISVRAVSSSDAIPEETSQHEEKSYETIEDWKADLVTVWEGGPLEIQFTYLKKDGRRWRRLVALTKLVEDGKGRLYMIGFCHDAQAERTFHLEDVTTMIEYKSRHWPHYRFLEEVLGVSSDGYTFTL